ncbi:MAG TPA: response regulator, partial [Polyangiaceae bacterium]|nr:response regulator [Polyangiaceae bacterium]
MSLSADDSRASTPSVEAKGLESGSVTSDSAPMSSRSTGRILIVDDNAHNLTAFCSMLEPLGAPIVTADSGEEALRWVLREEPALILLDVQMPGLDGYETARLIRSRDRSRHVPIIFLTALHRDERYIARGYSVGAVDYIVKPVDPDILRSKVEVFIDLFRKRAIIRDQAEQLRRASEQKLADYQRWSEQRYSSLADAVPELVWTTDASGTLSYRNRRWQECAGKQELDLQFADVLHPHDLAAFQASAETAQHNALPWEQELRFGNVHSDRFRWHLVRVIPTFGASGELSGWVGTSTDIEAQKRAQQALEMLAELTSRLGELSEGAGVLDEVVALALPVLGDAALLDVRTDDLLPRRVAVARPDTRVPRLDDPRLDFGPSSVAFTRMRETLLDVRAELSTPEGKNTRHARLLDEVGISAYVCVPLIARERVLGTLTFFTAGSKRVYSDNDIRLVEDVARRLGTAIDNLHLYHVAERERRKLAEAGRAKDVFLATLSHELRTPLNAIVGWTHLLKTGAVLAEQSERAIETIDRNSRTLAKLVGDLIDVSRIVAGSMRVEETRVDLGDLVRSAIEGARPSAQTAGVTMHHQPCSEPLKVVGDFTRLQQVLDNVLSNAIRFTPRDGRVDVRLARRDQRAVIEVRDTGQGISPEFLPSVFEPFRQARRTHERSQEGLGLGLAIVKHLVELHGGTVRAESEGADRGTTITIELPVGAPSSTSDFPGPAEPYPAPGNQNAPSETAILSGTRVVIVEDDPDGCELLETVLRSFGASVTLCRTAGEAYEAVSREHPDVLVSDIGLPDEDGLSLMRRVRATAGLAELPAVALTAYASKRDVAQALAAGFHAHVA